ncbi:MAG: hypothetical protein N3A56_01880 [Thermodesulfobacteriaceae bacterium]|nr:hypothetical protein [Thermodesulfobacteriaceae bacterium]
MESDLVSARGFHEKDGSLIEVKDREEISESIKVLEKVIGKDDLRGFINFKSNQLIGGLRTEGEPPCGALELKDIRGSCPSNFEVKHIFIFINKK